MTNEHDHGFDDEPERDPASDSRSGRESYEDRARYRTIDVDSEMRTWAPLLHFSLLAHFVIPGLGGIVAPVVIWLVKRNELPEIDPHGRAVMNAMISSVVYSIGFGITGLILFLTGIGILLIPLVLLGATVLGILGIIFPIIGGMKAMEGRVWEYPMSIAFFPVR